MGKLLILLIILQGCSTVEIHHEDGSMPKVEITTEFCDKLGAKARSDELTLTCTLNLDGGGFWFKT